MSRPALGRVLGVLAGVAAVLVVLAGSDWPPPRGFVIVLVPAGVLGVVTALLVPRMLERADRSGPLRAVLAALAVGAVFGAVVSLAFAAAGSGEPSAPAPGPLEVAAFVTAVAVAGLACGAVVGAAAIMLDRFRPAGPSPDGG